MSKIDDALDGTENSWECSRNVDATVETLPTASTGESSK